MSDETRVLQTADSIRSCLMTRDVEGLKRLYHPDYQGIGIRGDAENLQSVLDAYGPGGVELHTFETADVTVDVWGEVALVRGRGTISGTFGEQVFRHSVRYGDLYLKTSSGWQCIRSQVTEEYSGPSG